MYMAWICCPDCKRRIIVKWFQEFFHKPLIYQFCLRNFFPAVMKIHYWITGWVWDRRANLIWSTGQTMQASGQDCLSYLVTWSVTVTVSVIDEQCHSHLHVRRVVASLAKAAKLELACWLPWFSFSCSALVSLLIWLPSNSGMVPAAFAHILHPLYKPKPL